MIPRTAEFRAAVASFRRAEGLPTPSADVLRPVRTPSPFLAEANAVAQSVGEIRAYLREHMAAYANFSTYAFAGGAASRLSDQERDAIDEEATLGFTACSSRIDALRASLPASLPGRGTPLAHQQSAIMSLRKTARSF